MFYDAKKERKKQKNKADINMKYDFIWFSSFFTDIIFFVASSTKLHTSTSELV